MSLRTLQHRLYVAQRAAGDLNAAQRGPKVLAKRLIRRSLTRRAFRLFGNFR